MCFGKGLGPTEAVLSTTCAPDSTLGGSPTHPALPHSTHPRARVQRCELGLDGVFCGGRGTLKSGRDSTNFFPNFPKKLLLFQKLVHPLPGVLLLRWVLLGPVYRDNVSVP